MRSERTTSGIWFSSAARAWARLSARAVSKPSACTSSARAESECASSSTTRACSIESTPLLRQGERQQERGARRAGARRLHGPPLGLEHGACHVEAEDRKSVV